jgi:hypothetical protein
MTPSVQDLKLQIKPNLLQIESTQWLSLYAAATSNANCVLIMQVRPAPFGFTRESVQWRSGEAIPSYFLSQWLMV